MCFPHPLQVYSPTLLHAVSSSKGSVLATAFRNSAVATTTELARGLGMGGAIVAPKRHDEWYESRKRGEKAARAVLSGVDGADGELRVEVSYLFESDGSKGVFADAVEVMAGDAVFEVFDVQDGGLNDPEARLTLPTESVHRLMSALYQRGLSTIQYGLEQVESCYSVHAQLPPGLRGADIVHAQLPLGHLPAVAEQTLLADALSLRLPGRIGSQLRAGLAAKGFLGAV